MIGPSISLKPFCEMEGTTGIDDSTLTKLLTGATTNRHHAVIGRREASSNAAMIEVDSFYCIPLNFERLCAWTQGIVRETRVQTGGRRKRALLGEARMVTSKHHSHVTRTRVLHGVHVASERTTTTSIEHSL